MSVDKLYRKDVDILRGIAVLLVVLYHLDVSFFKSGFIGVDIFFVLSGYLIASIYNENKDVKDFYERRFRRILPAMLVVMLVFFCAAPLLFLPFEVEKVTASIWGSLFFIPNVIFWRDNDYFSNLDFSPLLHYWSLGVELQYYLIFPIIFWSISKWKHFLWIFLLLSLSLCIYISSVSAKTAFFLLPTRLWEFLIGYLAFSMASAQYLNSIKNKFNANYLSCLLIIAILVIATMPIPQQSFPGVYAILPVFLSGLFILLGISNQQFLDSVFVKVLRWIAKISFSIYLVHYPIIIFFKYGPFSEFEMLSISEQLFIPLIILPLAYLSFRFIESPFRNRNAINTKNFIVVMLVIYALITLTLFLFKMQNYFIDRYDIDVRKPIAAMMDRGGWRCTKWQKLKEYNADSCYLYKAPNANATIYLVGDSHIDVLKEVFVRQGEQQSVSVRLNKVRCLLGTYQCSSSAIIENIRTYHITDVVLHGYDYKLFEYHDLLKLTSYAEINNIRLHFIGPIPTYEVSVPAQLYKHSLGQKMTLARQNLESFNAKVPAEYKNFMNQVESGMVRFYFPEKFLCKPECLLDTPEAVLYFDNNHLTLTGAEELAPLVSGIVGSYR